MQFDGKSVLLTGGSGGIGSLIRAQLATEGAKVTVMDRVPPLDGSGRFIQADLATPEGIEAAAGKAATLACDVLINLAGIQYFGLFEDQNPGNLVAGYLVNLVAPARLTQAVLPGMKARGSGRIVNIGSIFGSIGFAHFATYSSAKAGLRGLSQALRRELSGTGVGVTYVAPRAVKTPLNSPAVLRYAELTSMNMDMPDSVATRIVEAIRKDKKDVYLGFPESAFVRLNAIAPRLIDNALRPNDLKARALFAPQQS